MDGHLIQVLIMIALLAMSSFFSATETSFSALNRTRLKNMAEKGNKRAAAALKLSENYDSLLSSILVGNNIVNISLASIGTVLFVDLMGSSSGPTVSTIVCTVVVLIFGEITPKSIAKEMPESFAMAVTPIMRVLLVILKPINAIFSGWKNSTPRSVSGWKKLLCRVFHFENDRTFSQDELLTLVDEVQQEGGMNEDEGDLLKNSIELFDDRSLTDILTPRVKVEGVPLDSTQEEVVEILQNSKHSRLPVYDESLDHIVGILHQKDFFHRLQKGPCTLQELMKKPLFVPETAQVSTTLKLMQRTRSQMAVVADEYGGTAGIVTMEDILEELVGEIWDEHDQVQVNIRRGKDGSLLILGDTPLDELEDALDQEIEDADASTVGGWVMEQTENIPKPGDSFQWEKWRFDVLKTDGRHVMEVQATALPAAEA